MKLNIPERLKRIYIPKIGIGFFVVLGIVLFNFRTFLPGMFNVFARSDYKVASVEKAVVPDKNKTASACLKKVEVTEEKGQLQRLVVPGIQMGLPVVEKSMQKGTWQVDEGVANFAKETYIPDGNTGNTVLFGHNKPNAFRNLNKLKKGDSVFVQTSKYQFEYTVYEITTVFPNNVDIMKAGNEKQLTLLTCNGRFDEKRLVIKARLKEIINTDCQNTGDSNVI